MAYQSIVDCYGTAIGAVPIARGGTFRRQVSRPAIESAGGYVGGLHSIDRGPYSIVAQLDAQDPLIVPTVAALTWPAAVTASGRVKAAATYQSLGVANAVLSQVSMTFDDKAAGACSFAFRTRAASTSLATEAPTAVAATPTGVARATTVRILSATFTPVGGSPISVPGITRLTWQAQPTLMGDNMAPGSDYEDAVDNGGWRITGSVDGLDRQIVSSLPMPLYLGGLARGTLALVCRASGQDEAASPPANQTITFNYLKFHDTDESLRSKQDAAGSLQFDQLLRTGVTPLALSAMIAVA